MEARIGWRDRRLDIEAGYALGRSRFDDGTGPSWPSPAERGRSLDLHSQAYLTNTVDVELEYTSEAGWTLVQGPAVACGHNGPTGCVDFTNPDAIPRSYSFADAPPYESLDLAVRWTHRWGHLRLELAGSVDNLLGRANVDAFRAGTCDGAQLFSSVCAQAL